MLKITIELIPHGNEEKKEIIAIGKIWNDGTGTKEVGNYQVRLYKNGEPNKVWRSGSLEGFQRLTHGAWDLLCLALTATLHDRLIPALGNKGNKKKEMEFIEAAKKRCPYWNNSEKESWKLGFMYAVNDDSCSNKVNENEKTECTPWSNGYHAGKTYLEEKKGN